MQRLTARRWAAGAAALGAAVLLGGWSPFGNNLTLGASVQLTGHLAGTGRYYRDGYQFAVDRINETGGVGVGGKTYKLKLTIVDSKSDPKLLATQYERLAGKRRADLLLGPYSSSDVLVASAIAEKYRVPMVQAGGASTRIFARGFKYVFGMLPPADDYFGSTIDMMSQLDPPPRTVGLISGDDSFDVTLAEGTVALLKKAGMEIVMHQQYSERVPNFFNILTLVKARAPDALLWSGHEAGAIRFIRESKARKIGARLLAAFTVGVANANFRASLGKDADYAFGMTPWQASERLKDRWFGDALQFAEGFEKKFGYPPGYHAAAAAAAVETFVVAVESAGSIDAATVRDALAVVDFESLYGRVRFGDNGQIVMPQSVIQVQNGKVIEVFTDRIVNKPLYPVPPWDQRS
jgi:branched-chain amino acid transport system substrate-binding protein